MKIDDLYHFGVWYQTYSRIYKNIFFCNFRKLKIKQRNEAKLTFIILGSFSTIQHKPSQIALKMIQCL